MKVLKNLTSPRLAEALFRKAGKMIPDTSLTQLYMIKYQEDQNNYNMILSQVDVNFSYCSNCQVQEVGCLNRQSVTLRYLSLSVTSSFLLILMKLSGTSWQEPW